jgi:hypothetical protein
MSSEDEETRTIEIGIIGIPDPLVILTLGGPRLCVQEVEIPGMRLDPNCDKWIEDWLLDNPEAESAAVAV